jgi:hypothetical protein
MRIEKNTHYSINEINHQIVEMNDYIEQQEIEIDYKVGKCLIS